MATDDGDDGDAPVELHAATTAAMAKLATSKVLERMAMTSIYRWAARPRSPTDDPTPAGAGRFPATHRTGLYRPAARWRIMREPWLPSTMSWCRPMRPSSHLDARLVARLAVGFVAGFVLTLALAAAGLLAYDARHEGRILDGVRVGGVDLSGLDREQAAAALGSAFGAYSTGRVVVHTTSGDVTVPFADGRPGSRRRRDGGRGDANRPNRDAFSSVRSPRRASPSTARTSRRASCSIGPPSNRGSARRWRRSAGRRRTAGSW